jgi:hypothetical protein
MQRLIRVQFKPISESRWAMTYQKGRCGVVNVKDNGTSRYAGSPFGSQLLVTDFAMISWFGRSYIMATYNTRGWGQGEIDRLAIQKQD